MSHIPEDSLNGRHVAGPPDAEARRLTLDSGVASKDCEAEPIHIPGGIQPHGYLIVLAEEAGDQAGPRITQASENIAALMGESVEALLGKPLDALVGERRAAFCAPHRRCRWRTRRSTSAPRISPRGSMSRFIGTTAC